MEAASIIPDQPTGGQPKEEPLYQQGRYPSIVDTDDLVFELGKQVVNHLNHEKIIGNLMKKLQELNNVVPEPDELKAKNEELSKSNKIYEEDNRKLGDELANHRKEMQQRQSELAELKARNEELSKSNKIYEEDNRKLGDELVNHGEEMQQLQSELAELKTKTKPVKKKPG